MAYQYLKVTRDAGVLTCTLTNPPMNFMNHGMVRELDALTRQVEKSSADRVLVFTGDVEGIFITHYDVSELTVIADQSGKTDLAAAEDAGLIHTVFNRLERMPKITIAALNGTAMGGGCELSLACDFRLMADGPYRYGLPETSLGIIPGAGGTQRLARLLGVARALDLILHGTILTPIEAHALGLVHRLFAPALFATRVAGFAGALAQRAPIALAAAKEAVRRGVELTLDEGIAVERRAFARTMRSADARGAMQAYLRGEVYEFKGQ